MKTLIKLIKGEEISRKSGYKNEEDAKNAGNSWLRDCTIHAEIRKDRTVKIVNSLFVIRNKKTDQNFDTNEMKFYGSNWEPDYIDDIELLKTLISNDQDKFNDCVIEEKKW